MTKIFLDGPLYRTLHAEDWTIIVKVKHAEMLKSFFGQTMSTLPHVVQYTSSADHNIRFLVAGMLDVSK